MIFFLDELYRNWMDRTLGRYVVEPMQTQQALFASPYSLLDHGTISTGPR